MIGGRVEWAHSSGGGTTGVAKLPQTYSGTGDSDEFAIELPARAEVYLPGGRVSVHGEVAAALALVGDGGGVIGSSSVGKGTYFLVPITNLIASFGATFYFP
jgi:hypothetical protein